MTASIITDLANLNPAVWLLGFLAIIIGTGAGFAAGLYYARRQEQRAFQRARAGVAQLYRTIISTIDTAQEVCQLLEKCPGQILNPQQTAQLVQKRNGLLGVITNLVRRSDPNFEVEEVEATSETPAAPPKKPFEITWVTEPVDEPTGLPGRKAFDENLSNLLTAGTESETESGLLLLRIDKFENLRKRLGVADADKLVKKVMAVVCRSVRDEDLVCRYASDMLAILLPDTNAETGQKISATIRDTIRSFHFRVEEHGPEIFLTASFGYTVCRPHDNADLTVNRGADALSKSQQRGRNQLHAHDGQSVKHLLAG